eukprot:g67296.t1
MSVLTSTWVSPYPPWTSIDSNWKMSSEVARGLLTSFFQSSSARKFKKGRPNRSSCCKIMELLISHKE